MGNQKSKVFLAGAIIAVAVAAFVGIGLVTKDKPKQADQPNQTSQAQQTPQTEVSYKGIEGKNALELLKQSHKVETKSYEGLGEFVTSIDGVAADSKHFWAFYVNGQQSQVGASSYTAKDTDTIVWKLEEIQ
jgi:hypothetical protein